jgi:hypothetical protein
METSLNTVLLIIQSLNIFFYSIYRSLYYYRKACRNANTTQVKQTEVERNPSPPLKSTTSTLSDQDFLWDSTQELEDMSVKS